ncbi:MAG: arginine--tRNA ligase [Candidatus Saganbacteria bacterium]|nr:arginine--tRNA ligase [Candidatus Saganbacteria bacterium]
MAKNNIDSLLEKSLLSLGIKEKLAYRVDISKRKDLGDYATNVAILAASKLSQKPLELASKIAKKIVTLDSEGIFSKVDVAKPGFINFTLSPSYLFQTLSNIHDQDHAWGRKKQKTGEKTLLEFVSANPTGPLHVGHGRWAVIGDNIGRLLKAVGVELDTEFYINDVGRQVNLLEASVRAKREGQGVPIDGYGGSYIVEIEGKTQKEMLDYLLNQQRQTLDRLGVKFDKWFPESTLHDGKKIKEAILKLSNSGLTYKKDGALWFKSIEFGDDKDRVLIREDKNSTYFAADVAYHLDKFDRGYRYLIDIWGTDHHGYVKRLKSAMKGLGTPVENFEIIIGQLVTLYRGSEPVRMSKRTGEMVTLEEVIDEIGADATRFFFSATDVNSHLDFDLELAKKKSSDNPVYYLQYAHARMCSILKKSARGPTSNEQVDLTKLDHPAERELMVKLLVWPEVVDQAARLRHPHRITEYGKELAALFHSFYEKCKVLGNPARLVLVDASRITLRNVLELLGISAPERM